MTVPNEINQSGPYFGNGVTKTFDYEFKIVDATHLKVLLVEGGVETVLTLDVDYTVTGVGDDEGGQIETTIAPTSSQYIVIRRSLPFDQEIDLGNQGAYYPETVEMGFDLAVMRDQELKEELGRTLRVMGGSFDAKGARIKNLADGVLPQDAATIGQIKPFADAAAASEEVATDAATTATAAATTAVAAAAAAASIITVNSVFSSASAAAASSIDAVVEVIRTLGYATAGDLGGALYRRVASEPAHAGKINSADGAWWEIVFENQKVFAAAFGVFGGGVDDHTAAIQSVIDAAPDGTEIIFPKSEFRFKSILIEKSVVLDWGMSSLTVDPERDSTTSALPAMFFRGTLSARFPISTVGNKLTDRVSLQSGLAADTFAPGDYAELLDLTFVPAWDDGLAGATGTGFTGRKELNRIKSLSGTTIFLEKSLEWAYSANATATVAKVTPLVAPGVKNIGHMTEPDPGVAYSGSSVQGPHLIAFFLCVEPRVENITVEHWQMQVCQFSMCQSPVIENSEGRYPYRPETAAHGYFVQFDRCNRGLSRRNRGYGVRHLVDWTQTYDCKSEFNTGYAPNGAQFTGHGQGARRCVSVDDTVHFGGGVRCTGWNWGNPSFSADYDLSVIRPTAYGRCDGIESTKIFRCGNLADGFYVEDPIVNINSNTAGQYVMTFAIEAGKNVRVQGGEIDIQWSNGGSTSDSVLYARTMLTVKCENISFHDVKMIGARSDNSYILRVEDIIGAFKVKNCTLENVDNSVTGILVSGASDELDITENRFLGGGFRGVSVTNAPTYNKRIRDNVFRGSWTTQLYGVAGT